MPNNKFRIAGVIRLSRSQLTVKVYSDKHGFIGLAQKNELLKLFRGETDYVDIVVFGTCPEQPQTQQQMLNIKPADPEKISMETQL